MISPEMSLKIKMIKTYKKTLENPASEAVRVKFENRMEKLILEYIDNANQNELELLEAIL